MAGFNAKSVKGKIVLLIIPNAKYSTAMKQISSSLYKNNNKMLYVTLNRMYSSLIKELPQSKSNTILFVDAITKTATTPPAAEDALFVSSPRALTELSININAVLNNLKPSIVLFDSISTLLIYKNGGAAVAFMQSIINKIKHAGSGAVFTALKEDTSSDVIKSIGLFVDEVITL
jgi:hypothetical protein